MPGLVDGHEFGGDDLNQINILDYLDDASFGIVDAAAAAAVVAAAATAHEDAYAEEEQ